MSDIISTPRKDWADLGSHQWQLAYSTENANQENHRFAKVTCDHKTGLFSYEAQVMRINRVFWLGFSRRHEIARRSQTQNKKGSGFESLKRAKIAAQIAIDELEECS
jgi:hypothetical protein